MDSRLKMHLKRLDNIDAFENILTFQQKNELLVIGYFKDIIKNTSYSHFEIQNLGEISIRYLTHNDYFKGKSVYANLLVNEKINVNEHFDAANVTKILTNLNSYNDKKDKENYEHAFKEYLNTGGNQWDRDFLRHVKSQWVIDETFNNHIFHWTFKIQSYSNSGVRIGFITDENEHLHEWINNDGYFNLIIHSWTGIYVRNHVQNWWCVRGLSQPTELDEIGIQNYYKTLEILTIELTYNTLNQRCVVRVNDSEFIINILSHNKNIIANILSDPKETSIKLVDFDIKENS